MDSISKRQCFVTLGSAAASLGLASAARVALAVPSMIELPSDDLIDDIANVIYRFTDRAPSRARMRVGIRSATQTITIGSTGVGDDARNQLLKAVVGVRAEQACRRRLPAFS